MALFMCNVIIVSFVVERLSVRPPAIAQHGPHIQPTLKAENVSEFCDHRFLSAFVSASPDVRVEVRSPALNMADLDTSAGGLVDLYMRLCRIGYDLPL